MHQDLAVSNIVGVEISDFEVVDEDRGGQFFVPDLLDRSLGAVGQSEQVARHKILGGDPFPVNQEGMRYGGLNVFAINFDMYQNIRFAYENLLDFLVCALARLRIRGIDLISNFDVFDIPSVGLNKQIK